MKISVNILRNYIDINGPISSLVDIMEDVGLEVKRNTAKKDDNILTLELLANRGDHFSYKGIAREIYGRTKWRLKDLSVENMSLDNSHSFVQVTTDKCLAYSLSEFSLVNNTLKLPDLYKNIIEVSEGNVISTAVDITNIVGLEVGQPLHVFDADLIEGSLVVRESLPGEKADILFSDAPVELPEGSIVISDDRNIHAVAGIIGCKSSAPNENTKRIYVESASFDPVVIRKTSKSLGIQNHSSMLFERGADPALMVYGLSRASYLFKQAGWENVGGIRVYKEWEYSRKSVSISIKDFNNYFGCSYSFDELSERLSRYNFVIKNFDGHMEALIPSNRIWDIKESKDIYEELARSIGYNEFPATLPVTIGIKKSKFLKKKNSVEEFLIDNGFYEVFTEGFYGEKNIINLALKVESSLHNHVKTVNAEDRMFSYMKNNTLSQALDLIKVNSNFKNYNIKAYEWTKIFCPNPNADNGLCDEKEVLWMISCGNSNEKTWNGNNDPVDVYYMKGIVEEIAEMLDIKLEFRVNLDDSKYESVSVGECLHPTRMAYIYHKEDCVGILGEVGPRALKATGIKSVRPYFIELSRALLNIETCGRKYIHPSSLLPVNRDICLLLSKDQETKTIIDFIIDKSDWLQDIYVSDVYFLDDSSNNKAVTFSLSYSLENIGKEKVTVDEINTHTEFLISETVKYLEEQSIFVRFRC